MEANYRAEYVSTKSKPESLLRPGECCYGNDLIGGGKSCRKTLNEKLWPSALWNQQVCDGLWLQQI